MDAKDMKLAHAIAIACKTALELPGELATSVIRVIAGIQGNVFEATPEAVKQVGKLSGTALAFYNSLTPAQQNHVATILLPMSDPDIAGLDGMDADQLKAAFKLKAFDEAESKKKPFLDKLGKLAQRAGDAVEDTVRDFYTVVLLAGVEHKPDALDTRNFTGWWNGLDTDAEKRAAKQKHAASVLSKIFSNRESREILLGMDVSNIDALCQWPAFEKEWVEKDELKNRIEARDARNRKRGL